MTPEAQRIAIAEACGYKRKPCPLSSMAGGLPDQPKRKTYWAEPEWDGDVIGLSDYLNDLNAMHEAEKVLTVGQTPHYVAILITVCGSAGSKAIGWPYITATAAQRAEAFLRTIGRWQEN